MTATHTPPDRAHRFHAARPSDLRHARATHRLAYIIDLLPARLKVLSAQLPVGPAGRVLDFGCAEQPYRSFFAPGVEFVGADLPGNPDASVEIGADGTLPLSDDAFDAVLSTQVLEHVRDPRIYLAECQRVLRPGGRLLLSTHGMMVYHPDPVDLWRWTSEGLREIVGEAGLEIVHFEGIMGLTATGLQFVQDAIVYRLPRRVRPLLCAVAQKSIAWADRREPVESRDANALVFALVAEKPWR
jgi:SAM-dependent methyltransferase